MASLRPTAAQMAARAGLNGLPRPASAGDMAALSAGLSQREGGAAAAAPTTSKNSGGSELFDALLMAATGTAAAAAGGGDAIPVGGAVATAGSPGGGEQQVSRAATQCATGLLPQLCLDCYVRVPLLRQPSCNCCCAPCGQARPRLADQVTSKHAPIPRQRSRLWHTAASLGEVDSLQNAVDAFKVRYGLRTQAESCVAFAFACRPFQCLMPPQSTDATEVWLVLHQAKLLRLSQPRGRRMTKLHPGSMRWKRAALALRPSAPAQAVPAPRRRRRASAARGALPAGCRGAGRWATSTPSAVQKRTQHPLSVHSCPRQAPALHTRREPALRCLSITLELKANLQASARAASFKPALWVAALVLV